MISRKEVSMKNKRSPLLYIIIVVGTLAVIGAVSAIVLACLNNSSPNATFEQSVGSYVHNMTGDAAAQLEKEIGTFEITAKQRELAANNTAGYTVLDAGRGNPNWINAGARDAYARLLEFATSECKSTLESGDMAGHAYKNSADKLTAASHFDLAMDPNDKTDRFLIDAVNYCTETLGLDRNELIAELVNGIIGDYYPSPSRCLTNTETILNAYLESTLYNGVKLADKTDLFLTEGGSAAMCYVFESLSHNGVLNPGDKIAIGTPIFTPYLQIPDVKNYGLVSIDVSSTEQDSWDIPEEELSKLEDKTIKAFFLVNPSNPASHALSSATLDRLAKVVEKNPELIILTDDVYGTFASDFQTVYSRLPHNTILVYSFSKLYGVTGWRLGLIAMNEDNIVDELIAGLPNDKKEFLRSEYSIVTENPDNMPFIERLTADSRSIGLYHTSGLSTPQQIFMDILALTHLVDPENDEYIELANNTVRQRYNTLMTSLGLTADASDTNACYYCLVNYLDICSNRYGADFANWVKENITDLDFLNDLAEKEGVVLMYGQGFDAPQGTVRISLANLYEEDYKEIASRVFELLDQYKARWEKA